MYVFAPVAFEAFARIALVLSNNKRIKRRKASVITPFPDFSQMDTNSSGYASDARCHPQVFIGDRAAIYNVVRDRKARTKQIRVLMAVTQQRIRYRLGISRPEVCHISSRFRLILTQKRPGLLPIASCN